ncbi:hypothetical protein HN011_000130 [Eciton burchellii]|nr:hypothetical protein HN011_000130 [Eciton burchellii]
MLSRDSRSAASSGRIPPLAPRSFCICDGCGECIQFPGVPTGKVGASKLSEDGNEKFPAARCTPSVLYRWARRERKFRKVSRRAARIILISSLTARQKRQKVVWIPVWRNDNPALSRAGKAFRETRRAGAPTWLILFVSCIVRSVRFMIETETDTTDASTDNCSKTRSCGPAKPRASVRVSLNRIKTNSVNADIYFPP